MDKSSPMLDRAEVDTLYSLLVEEHVDRVGAARNRVNAGHLSLLGANGSFLKPELTALRQPQQIPSSHTLTQNGAPVAAIKDTKVATSTSPPVLPAGTTVLSQSTAPAVSQANLAGLVHDQLLGIDPMEALYASLRARALREMALAGTGALPLMPMVSPENALLNQYVNTASVSDLALAAAGLSVPRIGLPASGLGLNAAAMTNPLGLYGYPPLGGLPLGLQQGAHLPLAERLHALSALQSGTSPQTEVKSAHTSGQMAGGLSLPINPSLPHHYMNGSQQAVHQNITDPQLSRQLIQNRSSPEINYQLGLPEPEDLEDDVGGSRDSADGDENDGLWNPQEDDNGRGKTCIIPGCDRAKQTRGLCTAHGGGRRCSVPDCPKAAQSGGTCKAHGGGPRCKFEGCTKSSQGGGLCRAHGGGKKCKYPGCLKGAQRGSLCASHGGHRQCLEPGCTKIDRGGGYCLEHGNTRRCIYPGCRRLARFEGACFQHVKQGEGGEAVPAMPE